MDFQSVNVVIVPADAPQVAIMKWLTQGRGNVLPPGAAWIAPGWWIRPPEPQLIELSITKWRQIGTPLERPAPIRWFIADDKDIPADRTYRNALVAHATEQRCEHDMPRARELHKELLREARVEELFKLDREWFAADRANDDAAKASVDARKQALLDVTADPRIAAAKTIEELKAITLPR